MLNFNKHDDIRDYVFSPANDQGELNLACQSEVDVIEDYLDCICAPLVGTVPRSKREEIRARVRQRLKQFSAAHVELGSTESEAIELALVQCGEPEQISQRWLEERHFDHYNSVTTHRSKLKLLDRLTGSATWATGVSTVTFGFPYLAYITGTSDKWWTLHSDSWIPYYRIFMFAVPLLSGIIAGLTAKHKPVRGVANAISILSMPALVLPGLLWGLAYANVFINQQSNLNFVPNPLPALCGLAPWLAMGCIGAGLGRRLRGAGARLGTRAGRILRTRGSGRSLRQTGLQAVQEPRHSNLCSWNKVTDAACGITAFCSLAIQSQERIVTC